MKISEILTESTNRITDDWFKDGFKTYKIPAKEKYEIADQDGTVKTLEGPVSYKKGDYIMTGPKGEQYPMPPEKFRELKDDQGNGIATPKKIVKMAKLADHDGVVNTSWGAKLEYTQGNDYIVKHGPGDYGVVKTDIFAKTYKQNTVKEDKELILYDKVARYLHSELIDASRGGSPEHGLMYYAKQVAKKFAVDFKKLIDFYKQEYGTEGLSESIEYQFEDLHEYIEYLNTLEEASLAQRVGAGALAVMMGLAPVAKAFGMDTNTSPLPDQQTSTMVQKDAGQQQDLGKIQMKKAPFEAKKSSLEKPGYEYYKTKITIPGKGSLTKNYDTYGIRDADQLKSDIENMFPKGKVEVEVEKVKNQEAKGVKWQGELDSKKVKELKDLQKRLGSDRNASRTFANRYPDMSNAEVQAYLNAAMGINR